MFWSEGLDRLFYRLTDNIYSVKCILCFAAGDSSGLGHGKLAIIRCS